MNTIKLQNANGRNLFYTFILFGSIIFSSYRGMACIPTFTYTAGANGHYTFTSTSQNVPGGTQYRWNPGDGSGWVTGSPTFIHTYTANATYNVELWLYSDSLTCNDSTVVQITVSNVTSPCILSASFTYTNVANGVVNFTSTSSNVNAYTQYYWTPGDSNHRVRGTANFTHQFPHIGNYYVRLTIEDTGNAYCADSVDEQITVTTRDSANCNLHADFTYTVGANGHVTFTNTSTGFGPGDEALWTPGDTTVYNQSGYNTFSHIYDYNGTYDVLLVIESDSAECVDSITIPITVNTACNMQASFTYDTVSDGNGEVHFTSTSSGTNANTIYKWTFGDNTPTVTGHDTITHRFPFIGTYTVTLLDSNASGCTSSVTENIIISNRDSLHACFTYVDSFPTYNYYFSAYCTQGYNANTYFKWNPGDTTAADSGLEMLTYTHHYLYNGPHSATLTVWYTILPHSPHRVGVSERYDESSYTLLIDVGNVTGVAPAAQAGVFNIYPNPNTGLFHISVSGLTNEKNVEIRVSNMMGQIIYQNNATVTAGNSLDDINLDNAANGVYLLQITTNSSSYNSKIVIQH